MVLHQMEVKLIKLANEMHIPIIFRCLDIAHELANNSNIT